MRFFTLAYQRVHGAMNDGIPSMNRMSLPENRPPRTAFAERGGVCRPVSRILCLGPKAEAPIIYLRGLPAAIAPKDTGRAAPVLQLIWPCSPQGLPFCRVAPSERELLPHIFTLTPNPSGRSFSAALAVIGKSPARCPRFHRVRCSVLSGLSSPHCCGAMGRPARQR